jgi:hypothetical protein
MRPPHWAAYFFLTCWRRDVCYWHLAGVAVELGDVRYRGQSGSRILVPSGQLLTRFGHLLRNVQWRQAGLMKTLFQPGSMPCDLITRIAEGLVRKFSNSRAAVGAFGLALTPPANWNWYCMSGGSGPTSSTPGVVTI